MRLLLEKFEINDFFGIYTSSDFGCGKYSGELYEKVLNQLDIGASHVLMIGDNKRSDIDSARKKGIRTFHKKWKKYPREIDYKTIERELWNLAKNRKEFAYQNYAFALYRFTDLLYKKIKSKGICNVLFLAREGEMLKELFDMYLDEKGDDSIVTNYFYVSRIASFAAGLRPLEEETFEGLFNKYQDLSIFTFLRSMGWNKEDILSVKNVMEVDFEKTIEKFPESVELAALKNEPIFCQIYEKHRREQHEFLLEYLQQMGIDYKTGINIVDVGWRGSIQDNLFRCFQGEVPIHGFYIGISKIWENSYKNRKEGLIFSEYPIQSKDFRIWNFDKFMFERILLASHATTISYMKDGYSVKPVFKEYANEAEAYLYIRPYQEKVKELFIALSKLFRNTIYSTDEFDQIFSMIHLDMLCKIGKKEVKMQKILYQYNHESFGEFGRSRGTYMGEILKAFKMNKIPVRRIIHNGVNFAYIHSISLTTMFISYRMGWMLPILYRIFYLGERKKRKQCKTI